ncbi:MAG TPA: hypothetical protein VLB01_05945 [Thermodesulfobacteriota bacterium]|nr:hypothetical protein [Thermodesulfobacteriota bacterium]
MKTILALFFVLSLVVTPLAIAGGLGSADSNFVFGDVQQASAVTMSGEEMESTAGMGLLFDNIIIGVDIKDTLNFSRFNINALCLGVLGTSVCSGVNS